MPSAAAIRPRRRLVHPGSARVDWQHPCAHRLQGLWLPQGTATFRNLINPNDELGNGGSAAIVSGVTAWGPSAGETSANPISARAFANLAPSAALKPTNAVTLMWVGAITGDAGTSNRRLCSMEYNNADASPYIAYGIYRDTTTTGITFACDGGSAFGATAATPITNGPVDQSAMAVLTYDGATLAGYWNGALATSAAKTGALAYSATSLFAVGSHTTGSVPGAGNAQCNMVAVWDRALSAEEIAELWADPFQLLLSGGRRVPLLHEAPAGAVNPSGTAAVTLANFTSSATGTETLTGTSANTLAAFTSSASGTVSFTGTSATTLANFTASGTGTMAQNATGTAAVTMANFTSTASGNAPLTQDTVSHDVRTGQPDPRWREGRRATWPPPLRTRGRGYGRY